MYFTLCLLFLFFVLSLSQCDRKVLPERVATFREESNFTNKSRSRLSLVKEWSASFQAENSSGAMQHYSALAEANPQAVFLNWGFSLGQGDDTLSLDKDDISGMMPTLEASSLQLYHFMAQGGLPKDVLQNKTVLEVGCGRGRGAAYVARAFKTRRYVGMDLTPAHVEIARRTFGGQTGLEFVQGNALDIPLPAGEFDVVLNVESSHNYPDFNQFAAEVLRVLKPGGFFLWTDILWDDTSPSLRAQQVWKAGFHIRLWEDIHESVLRSRVKAAAGLSDEEVQIFCDNYEDWKHRVWGKVSGPWPWWEHWALPGSLFFESLTSEEIPYIHMVAQKPRLAVSNEDKGHDEL